MRDFVKYWALLIPCVVFAFVLSHLAFFSYWYAARLFHSVPAVRASEAAGAVVLYPAHLVFSLFGGLFDQSTPDSDPVNYLMINAIFLGSLFYACLRPLVFRAKKSGK
jgi:hypothetical protein